MGEAIDDERSRLETPIKSIQKFVDWVEPHVCSTLGGCQLCVSLHSLIEGINIVQL